MKKVLVIDDDEAFRLTLSDWLVIEGFHSIAAQNGIEGIQLAQTHQPDLIFCDINMPQKNGFEVLEQLQNNLITAHIPFFFLTSEALQPKVIKELGAEGLILKSGELHELRQVLTTIES